MWEGVQSRYRPTGVWRFLSRVIGVFNKAMHMSPQASLLHTTVFINTTNRNSQPWETMVTIEVCSSHPPVYFYGDVFPVRARHCVAKRRGLLACCRVLCGWL